MLERLEEKGWLLGGENSGHVLCLDKHTTGDAIIAALAVLRALVEQRTTLAQRRRRHHALSAAAHQRARAEGLRLEGERRRFAPRRPGRSPALGDARPRPAAPVGHRAGAARDGRGARGGRCADKHAQVLADADRGRRRRLMVAVVAFGAGRAGAPQAVAAWLDTLRGAYPQEDLDAFAAALDYARERCGDRARPRRRAADRCARSATATILAG